MSVAVHDATRCALGEGPLWHPERQQFLWFDILDNCLMGHEDGALRRWRFDGNVSAAGWIDRDTLLVASETALLRFSLETGAQEVMAPLEADNPLTRSNDGRADPQGGFWIGTMGKKAEDRAGAIYRYYRGELRRLYGEITIPNAICFSPDGRHAYFTDTLTQKILRVALGPDGWPEGEPQLWLDLTGTRWMPDGAVCDAAGNVWNAQYGAGRVACYDPEGTFLHAIDLPASQTTCPAFGGADLTTLYCTSAAQNLPEAALAATPAHGQTFEIAGAGRGQAEHRVIL